LPIDSAADRWQRRDQDYFGAFAVYEQHPVAVVFAEISTAHAVGFEDPQAEQFELTTPPSANISHARHAA